MNAIEENRSVFSFYQRAARIVGWVLLSGGCIWLLMFLLWILATVDAAGSRHWPGTARNLTYAVSTFVLHFAIPGLLALLISQFIRYLGVDHGRPGWILRHGRTVLYACALALIAQAVLRWAGWESFAVHNPDQAGLLFIGPGLVPLLAKVLVCVGLGHVLWRVLPIIDESKTLI